MSKRPPCPPGYSWLSPYLIVRDANAALAFYEKAFGFDKHMSHPSPDGKSMHAEMKWHDVVIMFGSVPESKMEDFFCRPPEVKGGRSPMSLYLYCEDVDAVFARAVGAGAKAIKPPQNQFYGDRTCALEDLDGYWWYFATNVGDFDPSKAPA
jgi:uncharacterized glyoxalase superfamily protein PhnB